MKFTASLAALRKAMSIAGSAVQTKTTIMALSCFRLEVAEGVFTIQSTDMEQTVNIQIPLISSEGSGSCMVPARLISTWLEAADGESVQFALDKNQLMVQAGRGEIKLSSFPTDEFPRVFHLADCKKKVSIATDDFNHLVSGTAFACAAPNADIAKSKPYLAGVSLELGKQAIMTGADSFLICESQVDLIAPLKEKTRLIVPKQAVLLVSRVPEAAEMIEIGFTDDSFIVFKRGDFEIGSVLMAGMYPVMSEIMPKTFKYHYTVAKASFAPAIRRVRIMVGEANRVRLEFYPDAQRGLVLTAQTPEIGIARDEVEADFKDMPYTHIMLNVSYLSDSVEFSGQSVSIHIMENRRLVKVDSAEVPGWYAAIAPFHDAEMDK